jgi:hypothetical protein
MKRRAEEAMSDTETDRPAFVYITYIESTPEKVWQALTDPDFTAEYWGHRNVSDWQEGSRWEHCRIHGSDVADVVGISSRACRRRPSSRRGPVPTRIGPSGRVGGRSRSSRTARSCG